VEHAFSWTVEFREDNALELPKQRLSVYDGNENAVIEEHAAQVRCGVSSLAVGEFRRIVPVRKLLLNDSFEKLQDIVGQCGLPLPHKQGRRRVLAVDSEDAVTDPAFFDLSSDGGSEIDELLFAISPDGKGCVIRFHDGDCRVLYSVK